MSRRGAGTCSRFDIRTPRASHADCMPKREVVLRKEHAGSPRSFVHAEVYACLIDLQVG